MAQVTGDPEIFDAGVWIKHPGIAVGKLFRDDPRMITVAGDGKGVLHAWYPDGTEIAGFPKLINDQTKALSLGGVIQPRINYYINSTPALVDINGDGNKEIFVGSGDGWLYGLDNKGNFLNGWPQFTGVAGNHVYGVFSSPAVDDVDGDGNFEVVVGAYSHLIYVWNVEDGSVCSGWPFDNLDTVWSSPVIRDLDKDGDMEIVIGCDSTVPEGGVLRVLHSDGGEMTGWPQGVDQVIWSTPAVGDIDHDGDLEIVVGTGNYYANPRGEYVSAYELDGQVLSGWPVSLGDGDATTDNRVFSSPALADADNDGFLETFVGALDGYLYCINSDGTIRWRNTPSPPNGNPANYSMFSSPAVGDIDGDGKMEVVIGGGWHITAFDASTGTIKEGYPINTGAPDQPEKPMFTWSSPTIADVDGDGLIEILIGNGRKDQPGYADAGGVRIYHETGPAGTLHIGVTGVSRDVAPWPCFPSGGIRTKALSLHVITPALHLLLVR